MEDENRKNETPVEEGAEEIAAAQEGEEKESEKRRGYKPRKKTLVFEKGLDSIFRKRDHATDGFTREMERWQLRMRELNQQEREFLVEQHEDELRRLNQKYEERVERILEENKGLKEELSAARGMVRELQKELELEKDKRKRGIPLIEGEDEEWNPDEERARERVGDGRDESWLRK